MTPRVRAVLVASGVGKAWQGRVVFSDLNLSLDKGVYALQGPNGIGKSTLLGILSGATEADAGEISIAGSNLAGSPLEARRKLSWVPDKAQVYPFLSGRELLQLVALAKRQTIDDELRSLLKAFEVEPFLDQRMDAMSLGTQKKYLLLAGFIGDPRLFVADEPSVGLDKRTRSILADRLWRLGSDSVVLFASHDDEFIERTNASSIDMQDLMY